MNHSSDNHSENPNQHRSGSHRSHRGRKPKKSLLQKLGIQRHHRHKTKRPPLSERMKYRFEEFKAEFSLPGRVKRKSLKHQPLSHRIKTRLKQYKDDVFLPRVKKEKLPKPKMSERVSQHLDLIKDDLTFRRLTPKVGKRIPLKAKIAYFRETTWVKYSVIFSKDYLKISLNSLLLFISAYLFVHFITQLITGLVCHWFDIQTELFYSKTEYHFTIKSVLESQVIMNKWTLLQIITVFSSAPVACLVLAILAFRLLMMKRISFGIGKLSRKIRILFSGKIRKAELRMQEAKRKSGKRLNIPASMRLFLIWFICHSFTYFFSGMLFTSLFFTRFGYVTGYIFDSFMFDNIAASLSIISMVLLGFLFVGVFLHSSRQYFNQLVDWTRMPFVLSQIFFPAILGLIIVVIMQLPKIVYKLALMQVSMIILIFPILWRGQKYPEIQFDYNPRTIRISWKWIIPFVVISAAMLIALKIGIRIR
jgi:hypothetical protein